MQTPNTEGDEESGGGRRAPATDKTISGRGGRKYQQSCVKHDCKEGNFRVRSFIFLRQTIRLLFLVKISLHLSVLASSSSRSRQRVGVVAPATAPAPATISLRDLPAANIGMLPEP